jgi:DNA mismatch endonuclease (patch repair protein)
VVFPRQRVVVFVDGCFWHGCPEHYSAPRTQREFWATKLRGNVERDRRQTSTLTEMGWLVLRFWEHDIHRRMDAVVQLIANALANRASDDDPGWRVERVDVPESPTGTAHIHMVTLREPAIRRTVSCPRGTKRPAE